MNKNEVYTHRYTRRGSHRLHLLRNLCVRIIYLFHMRVRKKRPPMKKKRLEIELECKFAVLSQSKVEKRSWPLSNRLVCIRKMRKAANYYKRRARIIVGCIKLQKRHIHNKPKLNKMSTTQRKSKTKNEWEKKNQPSIMHKKRFKTPRGMVQNRNIYG